MNNTDQSAEHLTAIQDAWNKRKPVTTDWLNKLQQDAFANFAAAGFPTTRLENWKYTDLSALSAAYPDWLTTKAEPASDDTQRLDIEGALHITFVDGIYSKKLSDTESLPNEVFTGSLAELTDSHADLIKPYFGQLAPNSDMTAMNTAFSADIAAVIIPDNVQLAQPICFRFISSTAHVTSQPRLLISLGANSSASVIEHYSSKAACIVNAVSEIHCGEGANLSWHKLQDEALDTFHIGTQFARLDTDATLRATQIDVGAQLARNELHLELAGRGAHAEAKGLLLADDSRHIDSRITIEHIAPNTTSRERYRAILADKSRGVFNGRIHVHQDAQKTAAELTNRNLLLSKGAEINTKPELEIYADDVKCAHGSTTGRLDETSMFYLLSRGIESQEARNLLIRAFAAELLTDIGIPALQNRVQHAIETLGVHDD